MVEVQEHRAYKVVAAVNGCLHETILTVLIYIYLVCANSLCSMSLTPVTYILLSALHTGLSARWNPGVFGASTSRALSIVLLDFMFIKMGCYVLGM